MVMLRTMRKLVGVSIERYLKSSRASFVAEIVEGMATLLDNGVPLTVAMRCLAASNLPRSVRVVWLDSGVDGVAQGIPLSTVWQGCASDLLHALVVAGEQSGSVPEALKLWLKYDHQQRRLRHHVWRSSSYPLLIITGITGVFILLFRVVIPSLHNMYSQLGIALSPETRMVFTGISLLPRILSSLGFTLLIVLASLIWISRSMPDQWVRVRCHMPGYKLVVMFRTERFCSIYQLLLSAGVSLIDASGLLRVGPYPRWLKEASGSLQERVLSGQALSVVFSGHWDPILHTMVQWAEQTGDLSGALQRSAEYVSLRLQRRLEWIGELYGPLLLLALGLAVAATMGAVFIPLYSVMNAMGSGQGSH